MKTISTHQFYNLRPTPRLLQSYDEAPQRTPAALPHEMPVMALIDGGTPRARRIHAPVILETRTKSGKRMIINMHN